MVNRSGHHESTFAATERSTQEQKWLRLALFRARCLVNSFFSLSSCERAPRFINIVVACWWETEEGEKKCKKKFPSTIKTSARKIIIYDKRLHRVKCWRDGATRWDEKFFSVWISGSLLFPSHSLHKIFRIKKAQKEAGRRRHLKGKRKGPCLLYDMKKRFN